MIIKLLYIILNKNYLIMKFEDSDIQFETDDSCVYHYPKEKELRKLVKIDKQEEIRSWQYNIIEDYNKNQSMLQDFLECSICYDLLVKPLTCPYCGNVFCCECLRHWSRKNSNCPTCRGELAGQTIKIDNRLHKISEFVRGNWGRWRNKFANFYKMQCEIKLSEFQKIEELRNVISTNRINLHLFYKKYYKIKEKISINENLPSYSFIIKNEEHYEKAVMLEATRFNLLLESQMYRVELEQNHREVKEQLAYYEHGLQYFEQTELQKIRILQPSRKHEIILNVGFMVIAAISITL